MNEEPSQELVCCVKRLILANFEISAEAAQVTANELVLLAEDWGTKAGVQQHDWANTIKKRLGDTLPWRNEEERKMFYSEREASVSSYERYIRGNKRN